MVMVCVGSCFVIDVSGFCEEDLPFTLYIKGLVYDIWRHEIWHGIIFGLLVFLRIPLSELKISPLYQIWVISSIKWQGLSWFSLKLNHYSAPVSSAHAEPLSGCATHSICHLSHITCTSSCRFRTMSLINHICHRLISLSASSVEVVLVSTDTCLYEMREFWNESNNCVAKLTNMQRLKMIFYCLNSSKLLITL